MSLRKANLQAKVNIRKASQEERELLLGGAEESTVRGSNLHTKAGVTSAAESITESLRPSRQLMAQEVEISANTLTTFEGGIIEAAKDADACDQAPFRKDKTRFRDWELDMA